MQANIRKDRREEMAKKDTITMGTVSAPAVNIHFIVGTGGINDKADVMLIQAIFHFIGNPRLLGFALTELPTITGICDPKTRRAIFKFQQTNAKQLLSADGQIHPASYEGRNLRSGKHRMMTITLLHFYAVDSLGNHPEAFYWDSLIRIAPGLRAWLM